MLSFTSGMTYLRQEALKTGFILDSDNDDVLVERLSQVIRKLGVKAAEKADAASEAGKGAGPGTAEKKAGGKVSKKTK